ncbi:MAG: hypothetical protein IJ220_05005 [Clostridia bacterium]|nr:hypothetical protein [Clostridia bacterium]
MEDSLIVIFSMILAVLLMFLFPIMDTWERQDDISYMAAYSTVVEFVDSARNLGYITTNMYYQFLQNLNATGNRYDVTLEHRSRIYEVNAYKNTYTNEIDTFLNQGGSTQNNKYTMKAGDYFYVSVKNTNKTQSTLLKEVLYASPQETFKIGVPYGGMVRNNGATEEDTVGDGF